MKNKYLSKAFQKQKLYYFKQVLLQKATKHDIEIREVNKWFASSKTCHVCGYTKKDLTLRDREWTCPNCNTYHDRDINASINLRDCKEYKILNTDGLSGINDCGLPQVLVPFRESRQDETVKSLRCTNSSKELLLSIN